MKEFHYRWEWQMQSDPAQLWPLVADTNRFDHDTGLPAYQEEQTAARELGNGRHRLRFQIYGVTLEWDEEPFEWVAPYRFGVVRTYKPGPLRPIAQLRVRAHLQPRPGGGTHFTYEVWARPANWLGYAAIPVQIGLLSHRQFSAVFRQYDQLAADGRAFVDAPARQIRFAPGGRERLDGGATALAQAGVRPELVARLCQTLEQADDMSLDRIRPYALADHWDASRRDVLAMFLYATRLGLLDFRWDLLCPSCRSARDRVTDLGDVGRTVHCHTCQIDYTANFSQSVELTFRPNSAVRHVPDQQEYCLAGPQAAPHVAVQQLLPPGESRLVTPLLENGRYRLRTMSLPGHQLLRVAPDGLPERRLPATRTGWPADEPRLAAQPQLLLENQTDAEQLFLLERLAWSDDAVVAAEVTALQRFRDLFAEEALRPGDQIVVGSLTVLFTDLVDSTRMYREIGDAPAFGLVMDHFDVLRTAIEAADGAIVKTIGDAVMAVFRRPAAGLQAILQAQQTLQNPPAGKRPLLLKAALHHGPCIGVNLNGRFDYFGSTVNVASRLEKFASGTDVVLSTAVANDPEVRAYLQTRPAHLEPFHQHLKGFDDEEFTLFRLTV
jgi:adenylate cyclase